MTFDLAVAVVPSVAIVAAAGLRAFGMWLAHSTKRLEHAPLVAMQAKLDELEGKLLAAAMRGRG